ncbi:hypothetical protein IWX50DRAFT_681007 [Phyllosticta citricarpa]
MNKRGSWPRFLSIFYLLSTIHNLPYRSPIKRPLSLSLSLSLSFILPLSPPPPPLPPPPPPPVPLKFAAAAANQIEAVDPSDRLTV